VKGRKEEIHQLWQLQRIDLELILTYNAISLMILMRKAIPIAIMCMYRSGKKLNNLMGYAYLSEWFTVGIWLVISIMDVKGARYRPYDELVNGMDALPFTLALPSRSGPIVHSSSSSSSS
jgi:hypothetical protein